MFEKQTSAVTTTWDAQNIKPIPNCEGYIFCKFPAIPFGFFIFYTFPVVIHLSVSNLCHISSFPHYVRLYASREQPYADRGFT